MKFVGETCESGPVMDGPISLKTSRMVDFDITLIFEFRSTSAPKVNLPLHIISQCEISKKC